MSRLRAFCVLSLLSLLAPISSSLAQRGGSPHLADGATLTARGQLDVEYRGWQRFLVLQLDRPYTWDTGPGKQPVDITALELDAPGRADVLSKHIGEALEATGKLQLDSASPFAWNGVTLLASTVTLAGGATLPSQRLQPRVPAATEFYTVSLAMVPHQFEWRREAHDIETGDLLPDPAIDGCTLNGAGDLMDCNCTQGFLPVRAGLVPHPLPTAQWREIPPAKYVLKGMARFLLLDPGATHPQIVQVACKRKGLNTK